MKTERVTGILSSLGRFFLLTALTIEVSAQTQPLTLRSQWPGYPSSWRVSAALSGDYAYVVGTPGFHVFNVTNPAQPQLTGYLDGINSGWGGNAIEVVPPCAYFANSLGSFKVIDISQPTNPNLVGACTIAVANGWTRQLRVTGTRAYLAEWSSGLHVFEVSNPARPARLAGYQGGEFTGGVDVVGQYAYVSHAHAGGADSGFEVVDVSDPSQPNRVGGCDLLEGTAMQVRVAGSYAYVIGYENVAGDAGRLHVIDIRDSANPVRVGFCAIPTPMSLYNLCVQGHYVFASGNYWTLHVIDVSAPANPVPIGVYQTSTGVGSLSLAGDRLCLASGGTIEMFGISNPAQPSLLGDFSFAWTHGVCVDGTVAYTANVREMGSAGFDLIRAVNVSDPAKPWVVGQYHESPDERLAAFRAAGNRGYLLGQNGSPTSTSHLKILHLANPDNPVPLGSWEVPCGTTDGWGGVLHVDGSRAYAVRDSFVAGTRRWDFLIFDVSVPATPVLRGSYSFSSGAPGPFTVAGDYAYFLSEIWGLIVLDIHQPENPVLAGYSESLGSDSGSGLAVAGRWVYAPAASGGLRVIDVGDPIHPTQIGLFQPQDTLIWDVQVIGQYALVSGCSTAVSPARGYLAVLDIADPASPTLVADYRTKGEAVRDLEAVGNTVYVADDNWGLAIYDFVPPSVSPRLRLNAPVLSGGVIVLTWEGGPGIKLQKTTSLTNPNWQEVAGTVGQNLVTLPPSDSAAFLRLIRP